MIVGEARNIRVGRFISTQFSSVVQLYTFVCSFSYQFGESMFLRMCLMNVRIPAAHPSTNVFIVEI